MKISADFETRSPVDLRKCGAYVYFAHPDTTVLMCAYRIDEGPLNLWTFDQSPPADLCEAIRAGAFIHAWNASFEALGFGILAERQGWPRPAYDRYVDTMAAAAAMSLPRALGDAAAALGLDVQKDKEGMRLIRKFSVPRRPRKGENPDGLYWNEPADHEEDWDRFKSYCRRDVEVEEEAARRIIPLSDYERRVWLLDQEINRRGVRVDAVSARAAIELTEKAKRELDREMRLVTGGHVGKCSEPAKLVEWVQSQGVEMTSAAKAEIGELLECDDLPANVKRAVEIRQEAAKTSVSKLTAMLARASADDRVRGSFMYHGTGPGRWISTGVNFTNLPRPRQAFEKAKLDPATLFTAFRAREPEALKLLYGDELGRPLHLVSDAIRGFIWAAPGKTFVQADYTSIQGVFAAWIAGEDWKLDAIREINSDPDRFPDLYRRTAASIVGSTTDVITKKHPLRQSVGKVAELALGFGGGVSAFFTMAKGYGVDLDPLYGPVWGAADEEMRGRAVRRYEKCLKRKESRADVLSREAWIACEIIKIGWRKTNSKIAKAWEILEGAIRAAVQTPGEQVEALKVSYVVKHGFLWCRLPSGRCIAYGAPKLKDQVWVKLKDAETGEWLDAEVMERDRAERLQERGEADIQGATSPKVTVLGVNAVTKKWERYALYGGLAFQNVVMGCERCFLVHGMFNAEAAGYSIVAHVYDELLAEVPIGFGSVSEFETIICERPAWCLDFPIAADGWTNKRFHK